MTAVDLSARWPLPSAPALCDELLAAYGDASRHYHDLRHLAEVLGRVEEVGGGLGSADRHAVLLAAWFHDAVYDGAAGAEDRSARWAEAALPPAGVDPRTVREVARLVRLTETHRPAAEDAAGCALTDADLGILAADPDRYRQYAADVRLEYAAVPDPDFAVGRAAVLRGLLAKPTLFHTPHARERWEARARNNVAAELARLTAT